MRSRRMGIIVACTLLLIGLGVYVFFSKQNDFQTLTVNLNGVSRVTVNPTDGANEGTPTTAESQELTNGQSVRLKKGNYNVTTKGDDTYKPVVERVSLGDSPQTITITPDLSTARLQALLATEDPSIKAAIYNAFPDITRVYTIFPGKLYKNGDWYATKLLPIRTADFDTVRVVLHKQDGNWKVVTKPPEIIISIPVYPDIPKDVVRDVNNFL